MSEHILTVEGQWFNDSTAGVGVYCGTCQEWILDGADCDDRLTPEQIAEAAAAHRGAERTRPAVERAEAAEARLARVAALAAPQWRSIPNDLPDSTVDAFRSGRNWMIDQLRAALGDDCATRDGGGR